MKKDNFAKKVYEGRNEGEGFRGRPSRKWINSGQALNRVSWQVTS